ncbi:patatin-like protein [Erythrobacter sp. SCSIO 43205]|uniref:patatin-like protein n=1 Tax=Erythrobacter sp. SCSIO 43205 TaxID=2779361 RepID=UPI001CA86453|nr:patatin-like protein [Erythrobacter sp. SCSIO 43205]UAB79761.1 patatin-like protein [Erythrobacter sp. SCSIO 43205]
MRQKELRLALVCYGGVSLAVYMHGVTKEIWHVARASRARQDGEEIGGVAGVYSDLLEQIETDYSLRLRVLPDILTGASAGGINAVFLAQALYSGGSLEPLTDLWLKNADVSELTAEEAQPGWKFAKIWAQPLADWFLRRSGNAVDESVSPETRKEVRTKVSKMVRGRWFGPPFSGERFSEMLYEALDNMAQTKAGPPLLPPGFPVDLLVTATDFRGHAEMLRLNSPAMVEETEHRLPIAFRKKAPLEAGGEMADRLELVLAARATASFPGAFPPLVLEEIDRLGAANNHHWASRGAFLSRIMPSHMRDHSIEDVALIDGAVLVNAPFGAALKAIKGRTSQREVDRRFVYIEPRPDRTPARVKGEKLEPIGWFTSIFGSLSTIPREQPIRDDLERIEQQSKDAQRLRRIVLGLRPEIDRAVEKLFGLTFFLDRPTPKRLEGWRRKAQQAAAERAGYAFGAYAQTKYSFIVERLARLTLQAAPELKMVDETTIAGVFRFELEARGLAALCNDSGTVTPEAVGFFQTHDVGFRIRRLQLLARRLSRDWEIDPEIPDDALDLARARIYDILQLYNEADDVTTLGEGFRAIAPLALENPGAVLDYLARKRLIPETDAKAEQLLADALGEMPRNLKRRMLLTYLGFPFYDAATLPVLQSDRLDEYDPVKIDRISPDDALSIRAGGTAATLRGTEFYNFGAFFSRAYRENDYIWGRLHGAERMIDLIVSTMDEPLGTAALNASKRAAFLAILDEEMSAGRCEVEPLMRLRNEIEEKLG